MNQNATGLLKAGLIISIIINGVYGVIFILIPTQFVAFSGGNPVDAGWVRWPGGTLIAWALVYYLVLRAPSKQGIVVIAGALAYLLVGLALLYSWSAGETSVDPVNVIFPGVLDLAMAVLLYLGWKSSRDLLNWR